MKSKSRKARKAGSLPAKAGQECIICGKPATQVLDGDPSCNEHVELVYEDQVEKYTASHLKEEELLEKV